MTILLTRLAGIAIVAVVLWDTFEVMLLPVPVKRSVRLVMLFLRFWWTFWSAVARMWKPGHRRERTLGLFGPVSLVCLILTWMSGLIAGFSLIQLSLIQPRVGLLQALFLSGNTFFTLIDLATLSWQAKVRKAL